MKGVYKRMKKFLIITLILVSVLILASCERGHIFSEVSITSSSGAGTKYITVEILHDDAIKSDGELVEDNFSKHLPKGSQGIVDKLNEVKPLDDIVVTVETDDDFQADYITISYSFDSIEEYNEKTRAMAQAADLDIEDATFTSNGNEYTFSEKFSNLENSIEW